MDEVLVLLGLLSPLMVTTAVFATAWRSSRKRNQEFERILRERGSLEDRYDELAQAIDTVTAELESLREEQDFISRLLSARSSVSESGGDAGEAGG